MEVGTLNVLVILVLQLAACSSASPGVCGPGVGNPKTFKINLDVDGMGGCCDTCEPLHVLESTEHHGECLGACAEFPGCSSYNYHYDSTQCELFFCPPKNFSISSNCYNYIVSTISTGHVLPAAWVFFH